MARWIDLDSPEVQALIITGKYGNEYLDIAELDDIAHIFPVKYDKQEEMVCL